MSAVGLLLDEHVTLSLREQLLRRAAGLRVYVVGDGVAPPKATPDPALLVWMEAENCLLVTNNRTTMPVHLPEHLAGGGNVPGIILLPDPFDIGAVLEDLLLIAQVGEPGEFQDQIIYLPLRR